MVDSGEGLGGGCEVSAGAPAGGTLTVVFTLGAVGLGRATAIYLQKRREVALAYWNVVFPVLLLRLER